MIIDSHQHVFWHHRNDADLIADMDQQGIDLAWLLTWEIPPDHDDSSYHAVLNPLHRRDDGTHAGIPLSDLILARDRYPKRFVLGYCPYPGKPSAPQLFEAAYHMHGVRVCGEWKFRLPFDDPRCLELYKTAGRLRCPVVLHLDVPYRVHPQTGEQTYQPLWFGGTVENLERALRACPETAFIGHAPGFWREISGDADAAATGYPTGPVMPGGRLVRLLDTYPNLMADLSAGSGLRALARDPVHAYDFLCKYASRLLFARDYYGGELKAFLNKLNLPADVADRILFRNAQGLIASEPAARPALNVFMPDAS